MVTHRAASAARGFTGGNSVDMIDDDFESVFRKMIENFIGSMGFPEGEVQVRTWSSTSPTGNTEIDAMPSKDEPEVEEIDLGDDYMVLVETRDTESPRVHVRGREVQIDLDSGESPLVIHLSFDVDMPHSTASFQNGIIEIGLRKAAEDYKGQKEGYLQIE